MITQAFILGAGLGTRLRPLTEDLPKPLIPIFQKPLITFVLDHLIDAGIKTFVINTHHRADAFREFFPEETYRGYKVHFRHEPAILGTGGGIKNVESLLGNEPFVVYSGDVLTDIDLPPLLEEHARTGNDVTLALRETGLGKDVAVDGPRVIDIGNRHGHAGHYDFANVSVWTPAIFQRIPTGQSCSFIPFLTDWIAEGGKIGGIVAERGKWFNIGSRREYLAVHRTITDENWKPSYVRDADWPIRIAADAEIDSTATLSGYYSIGSKCRVGPDTTIEDTILWPGAQIASRSHLRDCIVRSHHQAEGELSDTDI